MIVIQILYFFILYQAWVLNEKVSENMPDIPRFAPFTMYFSKFWVIWRKTVDFIKDLEELMFFWSVGR